MEAPAASAFAIRISSSSVWEEDGEGATSVVGCSREQCRAVSRSLLPCWMVLVVEHGRRPSGVTEVSSASVVAGLGPGPPCCPCFCVHGESWMPALTTLSGQDILLPLLLLLLTLLACPSPCCCS